MDFHDYSNTELNQAVTCEIYNCHDWMLNRLGNFCDCGTTGEGYAEITVQDYCGDWGASGCILDEIFLELTQVNQVGVSLWVSRMRSDDGSDKLRAAMIVYLQIKTGTLDW